MEAFTNTEFNDNNYAAVFVGLCAHQVYCIHERYAYETYLQTKVVDYFHLFKISGS